MTHMILPLLAVGGVILSVLLVWGLFWKGLALWHAAQREKTWWFVALLVINTFGVLELIFLFGILKLKFSQLFTKSTENTKKSDSTQ